MDNMTKDPMSKEEICRESHKLLLEHHKQFAKILAKFAKGKVPTKEDWAKALHPFSMWKREWDRVSSVWDSEAMEFVTRKDLRGD